MRYLYIVITISDERNNYSYVRKESPDNNLYSILSGIPGIKSANIYPKNKAYEIAAYWNECYRQNGTYMFSNPF